MGGGLCGGWLCGGWLSGSGLCGSALWRCLVVPLNNLIIFLSLSLFIQIENIELKPGGADIDVTESNKKEYVGLLMKWRFEDRICKQMEAVKKVNNLIK